MKLSVLICTLPERSKMLDSLCKNLYLQKSLYDDDIEILACKTNKTIGEKRNELLQDAYGEYVCFIDDDDEVSANYIDLLMEGINKGVDCCSLKGVYSVDGLTDGVFEHSLKYKQWWTNGIYDPPCDVKYERYPNHLNCIRADIAKQFKFPEKNFGEDYDWSKQLHKSGLLKTEHYIEQPIYFYKKVTKK